MTEQLWPIPLTWEWTTISQIGIISSGSTPSTKDETNFGGEISWLTPADLSNYKSKFITRGARNLTRKGLESSSAKLLPEGTVLFSSRAPIGYTVIATNPIATNQGFKNVTVHQGLFNEYVYHWLKGNKKLAEEYASGTTFKELSAKRIEKIPIPIPPFNEQVRIVGRVEKFFSRLDAGVRSLQAAQTQLAQYRQTTLKQAYTGKLTEKWRTEKASVCNSVNDLLQEILKEGLTQCEGNYGTSSIDKNESLYEIPENWRWTTLRNITINFDSKRIPVKKDDRKKMQGMFPYYGASGIIDYVDDFLFEGEYLLLGEDGANLIARSTPIAFIAKGQFWVNNHAHVFRTLGGIPLSFVEHYINHISLVKYVTGTAQPKLSQRNMNKIPICIPPIKEQIEIVNKIDQLFSVIEKIQNDLKLNFKHAISLHNSILKKAFKGDLVPQDPNDEPASLLLESIKAQKVKQRKLM